MGFSRSDVEIVVVGQGAAAGATAWHLARAGRDVLLLPARAAGEDVPVEVTVPSRTGTSGPAVDLADAARPLWRAVEDETGAGLLSLTGGVDHGAGGRTADLARVLTARGHRVRWLTADDAGRRWPGMRFDGPVLHQPDRTGRVYAAQAARALRAAAVGRGAAIDPRLRVRGVTGCGGRVTLETARGPLRARRAVLVDTPLADPGPHAETVPGPWTGLWSSAERVAGFRPLGVNPCVVQDRDWPVFVRHAGPGERWPETVFGAPDPCGDVVVGFSGPPAPVRRLRGYVAELLPGLDAVGPVSGCTAEPDPADRPSGPAVRVAGALVLATGLGGRGTAYAPLLGRVLAGLAVDPGERSPGGPLVGAGLAAHRR